MRETLSVSHFSILEKIPFSGLEHEWSPRITAVLLLAKMSSFFYVVVVVVVFQTCRLFGRKMACV